MGFSDGVEWFIAPCPCGSSLKFIPPKSAVVLRPHESRNEEGHLMLV